MNFRINIILPTIAVCCAGCVLPLPHRLIHSYGVRAQIIDAVNGSAITNAEVAAIEYKMKVPAEPNARGSVFETVYEKKTSTDSQGHFVIRPVYTWHGAFLISPVLCYSLLPYGIPICRDMEIHVTAPGYEPRDFILGRNMVRDWKLEGKPTFVPIDVTTRGRYLETGSLQLVPAANTGNAPVKGATTSQPVF